MARKTNKSAQKKATRKITKKSAKKTTRKSPSKKNPPPILVIDVGGSNLKLFATDQPERIKISSGPEMTPEEMISVVKKATKGWKYELVSIGIPCPVKNGRATKEAVNLGKGWKDFDFSEAFSCPVKVINDAAMQALGCYREGIMLFLGIGTGLGNCLIAEGIPVPMEAAHLPYKKKRSYEEYIGKEGLARLGPKKWEKHARKIITLFRTAFIVDDLVIGGGNAELLDPFPEDAREVDNSAAIEGGFRLWGQTRHPD